MVLGSEALIYLVFFDGVWHENLSWFGRVKGDGKGWEELVIAWVLTVRDDSCEGGEEIVWKNRLDFR